MSLTNTAENELLDAMFGDSATLYDSTLQIALSTADPGEDGTGIAEPVGNGYVRVTVSNDNTTWNAASSGIKTNASMISFPMAVGSWGTISHWAIYDSGTLKHYGTINNSSGIPTPISIGTNDIYRFLAGNLEITAD